MESRVLSSSQTNRRVAQWQSASINTEEGAAFNSCSAYQNPPGLLFLSHCVPNPPNKGEKIRAHHELMLCARLWPVHLVCFARTEREVQEALELQPLCASVYVEHLRQPAALARAAVQFATGNSLTLSFYSSRRLRRHAQQLVASTPMFATLAYSSAMVQYAPENIPMVLDMVDADSEKWMQFADSRRPRWLFRAEGLRLREQEAAQVRRATRTFVTTDREAHVLTADGGHSAETMCNGVDTGFFDPSIVSAPSGSGSPVIFVGAMNYYPNIDAVRWFATHVFPEWKRRDPQATFCIVGRNPPAQVRQLGEIDGIEVPGEVDDVRPYLASARAMVAPMRIARGIQNKVLEALAMGKQVMASRQVAECFGADQPPGLSRCDSVPEYLETLAKLKAAPGAWDPEIRAAVRQRFSWDANLQQLQRALEPLACAYNVERSVAT